MVCIEFFYTFNLFYCVYGVYQNMLNKKLCSKKIARDLHCSASVELYRHERFSQNKVDNNVISRSKPNNTGRKKETIFLENR